MIRNSNSLALCAGIIYGLVLRILFAQKAISEANGLLQWSFLLGVPLVMGAVTAHVANKETSFSRRYIWLPLLGTLLFLAAALLLNLEGLICIIIILPLFAFLGISGALLYYFLMPEEYQGRGPMLAVGALALLPLLAAQLERYQHTATNIRRVENEVLIAAPPAVVWQQIIRVSPIDSQGKRIKKSKKLILKRL